LAHNTLTHTKTHTHTHTHTHIQAVSKYYVTCIHTHTPTHSHTGYEQVPVLQKALLRTAAYGLAFCSPAYPPHVMHAVALKLRLLNGLRAEQVGMPLTMAQLDMLGVAAVVARCVCDVCVCVCVCVFLYVGVGKGGALLCVHVCMC